jgi:hypothetical protein
MTTVGMAGATTRAQLLQQCISVINSTMDRRVDQRRAWSLFRQLRDHDTVDLADNRLFWELYKPLVTRRRYIRAALLMTVVP